MSEAWQADQAAWQAERAQAAQAPSQASSASGGAAVDGEASVEHKRETSHPQGPTGVTSAILAELVQWSALRARASETEPSPTQASQLVSSLLRCEADLWQQLQETAAARDSATSEAAAAAVAAEAAHAAAAAEAARATAAGVRVAELEAALSAAQELAQSTAEAQLQAVLAEGQRAANAEAQLRQAEAEVRELKQEVIELRSTTAAEQERADTAAAAAHVATRKAAEEEAAGLRAALVCMRRALEEEEASACAVVAGARRAAEEQLELRTQECAAVPLSPRTPMSTARARAQVQVGVNAASENLQAATREAASKVLEAEQHEAALQQQVQQLQLQLEEGRSAVATLTEEVGAQRELDAATQAELRAAQAGWRKTKLELEGLRRRQLAESEEIGHHEEKLADLQHAQQARLEAALAAQRSAEERLSEKTRHAEQLDRAREASEHRSAEQAVALSNLQGVLEHLQSQARPPGPSWASLLYLAGISSKQTPAPRPAPAGGRFIRGRAAAPERHAARARAAPAGGCISSRGGGSHRTPPAAGSFAGGAGAQRYVRVRAGELASFAVRVGSCSAEGRQHRQAAGVSVAGEVLRTDARRGAAHRACLDA